MYKYKYDTHVHTSESSACAVRSGMEQARKYKNLGYTGIIITDHFFNGNTIVDKGMPWNEMVDDLLAGYESAKIEGDKIGLDVFYGWEVNYNSTEFLIYGLGKDWLKSNPDILTWSLEEHNKRVRQDGGFIVHAHPFRERWYIPKVRLFPNLTDAVEVYNVGNSEQIQNKKAKEYAIKHNFPMIAGTDSHNYQKEYSGVVFKERLTDIKDFINVIKSKENYKIIEFDKLTSISYNTRI